MRPKIQEKSLAHKSSTKNIYVHYPVSEASRACLLIIPEQENYSFVFLQWEDVGIDHVGVIFIGRLTIAFPQLRQDNSLIRCLMGEQPFNIKERSLNQRDAGPVVLP